MFCCAFAKVNGSQSAPAAITIVDFQGLPEQHSPTNCVPCGFTLVTEDAANHAVSFGI